MRSARLEPERSIWQRWLDRVGYDGKPTGPATVLGRGLVWLAAALYTPALAHAHPRSTDAWDTFMYRVYFVFHEAGHVVFSWFGRFIAVAGGTVLQLLMPLACVVHFARRGDRFGVALSSWWLGGSLATVAPYVYDARLLEKPLHGGGTGTDRPESHDWFYLLGRLNLLNWDQALAWTAQVLAAALMWGSLLWAAWLLWGQWRSRGSGYGAG